MSSQRHYYNDTDPFVCEWARNLIRGGLVPAGDVDDRSIADVQPEDLRGYVQVHFFAGILGWPLALMLAGWPADREIWTGSCPCQGESVAGRKRGKDDPRHLWPDMFRLVRAGRPAVVAGEQVSRAAGTHWLDGVQSDMEGEGYAFRAVGVPSCAVNAPHRRDRLWWCGIRGDRGSLREPRGVDSGSLPGTEAAERAARQLNGHLPNGPWPADAGVADGSSIGRSRSRTGGAGVGPWQFAAGGHDACSRVAGSEGVGPSHWNAGTIQRDTEPERPTVQSQRCDGAGFWAGAEWIACHDGKARRAKSGIPMLAHGLSGRVDVGLSLGRPEEAGQALMNRVGAWRGLGNAINPQLAAEFIKAIMDVMP